MKRQKISGERLCIKKEPNGNSEIKSTITGMKYSLGEYLVGRFKMQKKESVNVNTDQ